MTVRWWWLAFLDAGEAVDVAATSWRFKGVVVMMGTSLDHAVAGAGLLGIVPRLGIAQIVGYEIVDPDVVPDAMRGRWLSPDALEEAGIDPRLRVPVEELEDKS